MSCPQNITEKKRIVLFTDTLCDPNGVSRFIQDMAKEADARGEEFYVLTSTKKHYCDKLKNVINVTPLVRFPMPFYSDLDLVIPPFFKLYKIAKELRPDVIHISTPGFIGMGAKFISKRLKVPTNGTYHTNFPAYLRDNTKSKTVEKITTLFMRNFYKDFRTVISRSNEYIAILKNDVKVHEEKLKVLKIGINNQKFHIKYRESHFWEGYPEVRKGAVKLLYVGRLTKEKNFPFLLELFESFKKTYANHDVQLIVIGEGSYLAKTAEYQKKDVLFMGYRGGEELSKMYANSDIFLFPSNTDTLGQVVLEAMSSGLPVIVSDEGGPKDIIDNNEHSRSGYSINTYDKERWLETMRVLVEDEGHRKMLGERGFAIAQKCGIEDVFSDFVDINLGRL